ncbi:MAG: hypothetical protein M1377_07160 [Deltaproteobacteria bacterium]|nr:hypothetical protein [Deltaproteobacteria bacterium]
MKQKRGRHIPHRIFGMLLAGVSILYGCTPATVRDVVVKDPGAYRYRDSRNGIHVAIDPYYERNRLVQEFREDLLSAGVLPVFIVVKNHQPRPLLIKPADISLVPSAGGKAFLRGSVDFVKKPFLMEHGERQKAEPVHQTAVALFPVWLPIGFSNMVSANELEAIMDNIGIKALQERTVFQGETHGGFVYFYDNNVDLLKANNRVRVSLTVIPSGDTSALEFDIPGGTGESHGK